MIRYFVRHPTAANLLMVTIILLGVLGALSLRREVFPEFTSEYINVRVIYKGASAKEVEETICERIEEEIQRVEGIEKVTSTARDNSGMVTIEVADGQAIGEVLKDVENAVEQIDDFPDDAEEPVIWEFDRLEKVCTLSLWAERMPAKDLVALADAIERELLDLDEVGLVETNGFSDHQIKVEVRRDALRALGLTIGDVSREIRAQSLDLPVGSIETDEREIKIRIVDQRRRAEEFRNLTIHVSEAGARIPLRAVATVTDTFEDDWTQSTYGGRRCVNLDVLKTQDQDTIRIKNVVDRYVENRRRDLPDGVHLESWGDWSVYVKDRLGMLVENGCFGFVLVFFTLWALLHWRLAVWVAVGIPISFLGTLFVMDQLDISLNMITMFALIMALGIIVDDAIVIGENIFAHYSRGKSPVQAAVDGISEVSMGVVASMLTTVAVFMPLLTMEGELGKILCWMPIGVITALAVSIIEGFLILPNHLKHSMTKIPKQPSRFRARINRFVEWLTRGVYGPVLDWSLRRPAIPLAALVMLFLVAVGMLAGARLKFQFFPNLDGDFLTAQVEMPGGTDLKQTREVVRRIEAALEQVNAEFKPKQPGKADLVLLANTTYGFSRTLDSEPVPPETGSHLAQVFVELLAADQRDARCDDVLQRWRELTGDVPDAVNLKFEQLRVTPGGKPVDLQLKGRDLFKLKQASRELQEKVATYPGIHNVTDNLRPGKEEVLVKLKPAARPLGIDSAALAVQLREAFWGSIAEEFQRGGDTVEVEVLFAPDDRHSLGDLDDFEIRTPDGRMIPFHLVASAERVRGFSQIVRVNRQRSISVTADLDTSKGNADLIMESLEKFFPGFRERHPGISLEKEGEAKEKMKTGMSVLRGFVIGMCIIFLLLSFVFKSFVEPMIVMLAIPFALIGAVAGHMLLRIDFTMPSVIGFVSLTGIVVNDSIVLVTFIKLRLAEGKDIFEAVHEAGMQRFRPVFLTSATTVAGLLPIMVETSLQAQFLIPMAVSISFGLMFATVVVLVLVPCLYGILARLGWSQKIETAA